LNCWDTGDRGKKIWGFNLYDEFHVPQRPKIGRQALRDYGYTSSPLVLGDALLVEVGSKQGNLVAFARQTGKQLWVSENKDPAGHNAGPVPMTLSGVPCVALLTIKGLVVTRVDKGNEGKTVAEYPWATDFANNIASPAVHEDSVLITSAYNHNAICKLKITLQGATKVWEKPLPSKVCTPVIYNSSIYWSWQTLKCLEWETGALKWEGGSFGDPGSCIATADGRVIVWGGAGKLALVETAERSPKGYKVLALKEGLVSTDAWPHVVLSGGHLYLKDWRGDLKCYKVGK
jgi:outer membrane protein assembly factor BamB